MTSYLSSRNPLLPLMLAAGICLPNSMQAQQTPPQRFDAEADSAAPGGFGAARRLIVEDGKFFVEGVGGAVKAPTRWSSRELALLPLAAGSIAALSLLDNEGRDFMRRNQSPFADDVARLVEPFGTVANYKILGGFYLFGLVSDDKRARAVAAEGVASSLVAGALITPALQALTGRRRPRTDADPHTFDALSGHHSFPSGHTTQAFAVASVIATEYDETWVKVSAYGLASLVGLQRMYKDAHYLSDVTAAAVIGTLVGRGIVRFRHKRDAVQVTPLISPDDAGLAIRLRF